jgi:acetolactate synthase-1/2/3 large subunit
VCIGGAGPKLLCDMGSLQDMDAVTLMRPITKWSVQVPDVARIAEYIDSAFRIAQANVPGPVFLEMPLDLLMNMADDALPATNAMTPPRPAPDSHAIDRAIEMLSNAKKPCFLVGSQLRWGTYPDVLESLRAAADRFRAPFFLNGMARGALPADHPALFSRSRKFALAESDLVFVFGTPFDFRVDYGRTPTWNANVKIIQVDLDGAELGRNRKIDLAIHADTGTTIRELVLHSKNARHAKAIDARGSEWLDAVRAEETKRRAKMLVEMESDASPPNPLRVCAEIGKHLKPNDVVIGDGGDFVATAAYVLKLSAPQLWMDPGPLGTLGVGPGYAMAAKLMRPDANVVLVYGDGSFGLHALEFEAMARQGIGVVAVIGNDAAWTQIRRGQLEFYGPERAVATSLDYTRYEKIVEACGGFGAWVDDVKELAPALVAAFAFATKNKKPACVNVKIALSEFRKGAISV